MSEPSKVAVIGVGRMGAPIAGHLIDAGHEVRVFDISEDAVAALVARGAFAAATPAEAAQDAAFVSVVVFDDAQAIDVISGADGVLPVLAAHAVIAVHTTVSIGTIHELAAACASTGVTVLDAGISGGEEGAQAGTLLTMVGGPTDAVTRATPVLLAFSKDVIHAGGVGAGMALKLARNATGYMMMAAIHEAMLLADSAGVDLALLRRTIDETGVIDQALSPFMLGGPAPLPEDSPASFRTLLEHVRDLGEKDLDQALDLADHVDVDLPVARRTRETFARVMRLAD
jgi:3-hydroxyisobutyrate dehydrogenase-like beta-hydroxyacid dehydrogenase